MVGINDSRQKIVTNGLEVNYDPAQLRSYPTTGTTVFDLSKNGNNGTLNVSSFSSLFGGIFILSSSGMFISTPYNQIGTNNSTMILWYFWNGDNAFKILYYLGNNNTGGMGFLQLNNNQIGVFYGGITTSAINNGTAVATLTPLVWTQLAITRNGTRTTLYQDGAYLGYTDNTPAQNLVSSNLRFGGVSGSTFNLDALGPFEFYGRQLSDTEILQNFNANKIRYNYDNINNTARRLGTD